MTVMTDRGYLERDRLCRSRVATGRDRRCHSDPQHQLFGTHEIDTLYSPRAASLRYRGLDLSQSAYSYQ
jgi:hypothetical protein